MMKLALRVATAVLAGCALFTAGPAGAQYPTKPVKLIVPFIPGSSPDVLARTVGHRLAERLGRPVVIDNRSGAAGSIGAEYAAKQPADGYALMLAISTHLVNPSLYSKVGYDPIRDFTPVALLIRMPAVLVVPPDLPVKTVAELVALAKAKPGQLSYGSAGPGTGGHLSVEMLKWMTGTDIVHVPYKGAAPALTDLVGGQLHVICTSPLPAMPHVKAGRLRALAMTSTRRSPSAPDIPTVAETVPGYESTLWYALLAPAGTPDAVVKRVHAETLRALKSPEMSEQLSRQGAEAVGNSPAELQAFIRAEIARWTKVIRAANITAN
jgi:tripartite-type tricarboxylate transporter receptor subunit TctC